MKKVICDVKSKDFYKFYKQNNKTKLTYTDYNKISKDIADEMINVLYSTSQIKLNIIGKINIFKKKRKIVYNTDGTINKINYKVDWKKTKDYWKIKYPNLLPEQLKEIKGKTKIYCDSEFRLFFKYDKRTAKFNGKSFIYFIPSRTVCRNLNVFIKSNHNIDYIEKY